jgi:hypothetical protein
VFKDPTELAALPRVHFGLQLDSTGRTSSQDKGCKCLRNFGGPGEIRTHDLFHAMEARSQLRHRPADSFFQYITPDEADRVCEPLCALPTMR